ncbi:MAG: hypothetical protein LBF80_05580 [Spirochaetaceae bacterium]|jgi:predicted RecB family endonuclease|nr:hypothetical protein [Spirochaetaceae bacterium]
MMTAEQAAEKGKSLSFEKVWAMFEETERFMKELSEKADRRQAETQKEVAAMCKRVDRVCENVGGLNRSIGELIETLVASRLWEKFPNHNLVRAYRRMPIYDETHHIKTDIDILLSDTVEAMAVEVKRELDDEDAVNRHLRRMELIRAYPPAEIVNKKLLGAMAGGFVSADAASYAYEAGFYVLELTGESVHLIPPPLGFEPRAW